MRSDFWIMRPFNRLFFSSLAAFLLLLLVASILLHRKSERTKDIVLITACVITLIGFIFYKAYLSADREYNIITANMGGFNWWGELPLQLCNINMLMIPIAVWRKSRPLACFCFFLGPLGALMALVFDYNNKIYNTILGSSWISQFFAGYSHSIRLIIYILYLVSVFII